MTLVDSDLDESERWHRNIDVNEVLDLDDEDAETGLPSGRERSN